jgi:transglutaminase superfamily protein
MMALLRKIRRRSIGELSLLVAAVVVRAVLLVLLRVMRFATLRRVGTGFARAWRRGAAGGAAFEHRVAWAVATAAALLPAENTCLADALTAHWMLEAGGCPSTIRFGVAAASPHALRAHAWVEANSGIVVGAAGATAFAALD